MSEQRLRIVSERLDTLYQTMYTDNKKDLGMIQLSCGVILRELRELRDEIPDPEPIDDPDWMPEYPEDDNTPPHPIDRLIERVERIEESTKSLRRRLLQQLEELKTANGHLKRAK